MKRITVINIFFILIVYLNNINAGLAKEVQADLIKNQIFTELKQKKYSKALKSITKYKELSASVAPAILIMEAKLAGKLKDYSRSFYALEEYFEKYNNQDKHYKDALALFMKVKPLKEKQVSEMPRTLTEKLTGMELIKIPSGCFQMGGWIEKPIHRVCITKDYYLGKYEVTQGQWQTIMGNNPSNFKKRATYPVENVSWDDIQTFIRKLNRRTGKKYRLPTEAEWEYAARAGTSTSYSFGNNASILYRYANFCDVNCEANWKDKNQNDSYKQTSPVGIYLANTWGLYDMHGNVWEWVLDWYGENYYQNSPTNDPPGPSGGSYRVYRGGSWRSDASNARSADRYDSSPGNRDYNLGFRLARTL